MAFFAVTIQECVKNSATQNNELALCGKPFSLGVKKPSVCQLCYASGRVPSKG